MIDTENMAATRDEDSPGPQLEESSVHAARASRSLWHGLISLAILVALVTGLLLTIPGLHGIAHAVTHMQAGWLVLAVGLEVLSCVGYVLAFLQVFDRAPVRFGAEVALSELAFGAAVSLGGAGSVAVGAWLLIDRGAPPRRIAERSAVLFLLTSAVNLITLVIFGLGLFLGLLPGPRQPLLSIVPAAVGVAALVFFLGLPRLTERWTKHQAPGRIRSTLMTTAESIRSTRHLLVSPDWRILGAIGYLWFDIGVLIACFAAAGKVPPLAPLVLAYQIGFLSNLLPIPGNVGTLDASVVGMLVLYGISATTATAATVVYHAIALWIPAMWGTGAFLAVRRSRGQPLKLRPSLQERRTLRSQRRRQGPGS